MWILGTETAQFSQKECTNGILVAVCGKLTGNEHEYGIFVTVCGKLTGNEHEYGIFVAGVRETYRQ